VADWIELAKQAAEELGAVIEKDEEEEDVYTVALWAGPEDAEGEQVVQLYAAEEWLVVEGGGDATPEEADLTDVLRAVQGAWYARVLVSSSDDDDEERVYVQASLPRGAVSREHLVAMVQEVADLAQYIAPADSDEGDEETPPS